MSNMWFRSKHLWFGGILVLPLLGFAELPDVRMVEAFPKLTFERPIYLTHAGDKSNRLFVAEQSGRIVLFPNKNDAAKTEVFLDIRERVLGYDEQDSKGNEEGLLGMAFHPKYSRNGYFYVYYSVADPRRTRISRFSVAKDNPDHADPASEKVILEIPQPYSNHNGGTLLFGRDGYLYLGTGDGGNQRDPHGNGQNLTLLLAKVLRIDVDREQDGKPYAIPRDNPFVKREGARPEIFAYGMRNPWRMSFDRKTGELWAGDVGEARWDEVDIITKGGNYGWSLREGKQEFKKGEPQDSWVDPISVYGRKEGLSITGGYVYRGKRLKQFSGAYLYADYVLGNIFALRRERGKVVEGKIICRQPKNIASFGEDAQGELYLCVFDGKIYKLEYAEEAR